MLSQTLQYLFSGLTSGAIYALSAIGFAVIYNASGVINFAQGEFLMIGGVGSVMAAAAGVPLPLAVLLAVLVAALAGFLLERLAIERARNASPASLIIITIGASILLQGVAQVVFGKGQRSLPPFLGDEPIRIAGASLLPQSALVVAVSGALVAALIWFFDHTRTGKALLATSHNRLAAQLVGIDVGAMLALGFVLSAAIGSLGGAVAAPITLTSADAGIMLGLKGFVAATLGGLGNATGAVAGGLLLGVLESLAAGFISSAYKDAVPFVVILLILFVRPRGLFGAGLTERV